MSAAAIWKRSSRSCDVGVAIEIDVGERVAVAREELLDAQRARGVRRADQHDVADAVRDQLDAAEDERAHQDLAQLGVGLHQASSCSRVELDRPRPARWRARAPASGGRDHVRLAGELARPVHGHQRVAQAGRPDDLDLSGSDDEERDGWVAGLDSTSPRAIARSPPCAAMRAIWAGVSVGNISAACAGLISGTNLDDSDTVRADSFRVEEVSYPGRAT